MTKNKPKTTEQRIIDYLNELTGRRYRYIKTNITPISTLLEDEYTEKDFKEVILLKTLEWKNNPKMSQYLCPSTLFRYSNFEKYINQVIAVNQNPELYKDYYEQLNKKNTSSFRSTSDEIDAMFGD